MRSVYGWVKATTKKPVFNKHLNFFYCLHIKKKTKKNYEAIEQMFFDLHENV